MVKYAKATMLDEIERAVILCNKADEYDVPALTDDEEKQCASKAEDYMASIGEDIAAQFSGDSQRYWPFMKRMPCP